MSDMPKLPTWHLRRERTTCRKWKSRKRAELKAIIDAVDNYHIGSAWTPYTVNMHRDLTEIKNRLELMRQALSVKNWGR